MGKGKIKWYVRQIFKAKYALLLCTKFTKRRGNCMGKRIILDLGISGTQHLFEKSHVKAEEKRKKRSEEKPKTVEKPKE